MDMFVNYDNTPSTYIPNNICKKNPQIGQYPPKLPYAIYNANGEVVGYEWNYGDTVVLNFTIKGHVTCNGDDPQTLYDRSIAGYMVDGNEEIIFRIFNFRYEMVYEASPTFYTDGDDVKTKIYVYDELSDVLVKGKYYITLSIVGTHEDPNDPEKQLKVRQFILIAQVWHCREKCLLLVLNGCYLNLRKLAIQK